MGGRWVNVMGDRYVGVVVVVVVPSTLRHQRNISCVFFFIFVLQQNRQVVLAGAIRSCMIVGAVDRAGGEGMGRLECRQDRLNNPGDLLYCKHRPLGGREE